MTRPPQLPPSPPPEPLDASERDLARALRNLPAGIPPPELDARILGAARRAVHLQKPQPRDRRWLIGLSTAATAVLAMGILLKMHGLGRDAVLALPTESESAATPASAPSNAPHGASAKNSESSMAADTNVPAGVASGMAAAAPVQPPQDKDGRLREEQSVRSDALAAKQAPRAFPAELPPPRLIQPPPPFITADVAPMPVHAPAPAAPSPAAVDERKESDAAASSGYVRRDAAALSAPATAGGMLGQTAQDQAKASKSASNAMEVGEPAPQRQELDKVEVPNSKIKKATGNNTGSDDRLTWAVLPSIDDDAKLPSAQWIERIRLRIKSYGGEGARESLKRFKVRYPDASIPDDLLPLLQ